MARQIFALLERLGHEVELVSEFRSYLRDPEDFVGRDALLAEAELEKRRIAAAWRQSVPPDLWVCYHPYYKSPDLIGPELCRRMDVPWVTFEASQSARRAVGAWADWQARALEAVTGANVNISLTARDAKGLEAAAPDGTQARMVPFVDAADLLEIRPAAVPGQLLTIAMMRPGDKTKSYEMLAEALSRLLDIDWHLTIVGDGSARQDIEARFSHIPPARLTWTGQLDPSEMWLVLRRSALLVWPGWGEAYGLAYLEAQGAGLPVVAQDVAGVSEVVSAGETGLLTPAGDVDAYAKAIRHLLKAQDSRTEMAAAARRVVADRHSLGAAGKRLSDVLNRHVWVADD